CVLFGHAHFAPLVWLLPAIPTYLVTHGIEVWKRLPLLKRWAIRRIQKILCVSRYTRDRLIDDNRVPAERCAVLPNTFYLAETPAASWLSREQMGLPGGKMILTVSRLSKSDGYKKIDLVIESLPQILREVPDAFYVVVGQGEDLPRLQRLARAAGVKEKVFF